MHGTLYNSAKTVKLLLLAIFLESTNKMSLSESTTDDTMSTITIYGRHIVTNEVITTEKYSTKTWEYVSTFLDITDNETIREGVERMWEIADEFLIFEIQFIAGAKIGVYPTSRQGEAEYYMNVTGKQLIVILCLITFL